MKLNKLNKFTKGWFVGDFNPTLVPTNGFEVAVKEYKAGDYEEMHYHKIATEITVICSGKVEMNGSTFVSGDIITIEPGETTDFKVIEDTITTVVKIPCVKDDKYIV